MRLNYNDIRSLPRSEILSAMKRIDSEGVPPRRQPRNHFVRVNGKLYPAKYLVFLAVESWRGLSEPFKMHTHVALQYLRERGYEVIESSDSNPESEHPRVSDELKSISNELDQEEYFSTEESDERLQCLREIVQRQGQADFRTQLLEAYQRRCAVTGCDAVQALEVAHISPYRGQSSQHVSNGVLLRADIHTLFDLDLIGICPDTLTLVVDGSLLETCFADLDGQKLNLPRDTSMQPSKSKLNERWLRYEKRR